MDSTRSHHPRCNGPPEATECSGNGHSPSAQPPGVAKSNHLPLHRTGYQIYRGQFPA